MFLSVCGMFNEIRQRAGRQEKIKMDQTKKKKGKNCYNYKFHKSYLKSIINYNNTNKIH